MFKAFCFLVAVCMSVPAHAYVRTMAISGTPLYWTNPTLLFNGNLSNSSNLSSTQVKAMLNSAFSSWSNAGGSASMSYSNSATNNRIAFTSQGTSLGYGVIAITEVMYYVRSGQIVSTDTTFNDNNFLFTSNAGDTGQFMNGKMAIYLPDVATHEAGHALGFDHSTVNKSTLIYTAFSGQYVLGNDDAAAVQTAYPATSEKTSLHGRISGLNGGIFGAHLQAINLETGAVQAGALSSSDGEFQIGDIPPGNYAVMMEPLGTGSSSISSYYDSVNHRFCGGRMFQRKFYSSCNSNGKATVVSTSAGRSTELGTLSPSCSQMGNPGGAPTSISTSLDISSGAQFGTLTWGGAHYYALRNVSGDLSIKAASYTLYSPIDIKVEILTSNGTAVAGAASIDNVENPMPGGKINYDSSATATNLPTGDYILKVSATNQHLSTSLFPAGFDLLDTSGHYLLMVGINGDYGAGSATDMSACTSVTNYAQSPTFSTASEDEDTKVASGCGTLEGGGGGSGPLLGGLAPALLLAALARCLSALVQRRR